MASRLGLNLIRKTNGSVSRLPVRQLSTEVTRYQDNLPSKQEIDEKVTHTGQRYPLDDFRRVRFENARRLVNEKFAIELIKEEPIVVCDARVVCSSSGGPLGHPKIFINLDKNEVHDCGYSGRRFIKKKFYDESKHGKSITYEQYWNEMIKKETESV